MTEAQGSVETRLTRTQMALFLTDDPLRLQSLMESLKESHVREVKTVQSDNAMIAAIQVGIPSLIVLDMPELSAEKLEVCRRIRQQPEAEDVPIVILTDTQEDRLLDLAFEKGVTDCLVRPYPPTLLHRRIQQYLDVYETQYSMRLSEERHRIISNTISDYAYSYIVLPDGNLKKDWSTAAFHTITGYSFHEVDQNGWLRLIHPDDLPIAEQRFARLLSGEVDISEFRIITKGGETRWLRDHGHPVVDEKSGRVVHIYGAAQDITERRRYEETLTHQAQELKARNEELDAFAYTVAHDLKNPIASMMGFASLVKSYHGSMGQEKMLEYVDLIIEGGYKLRNIINALLLLAGVNKMEQAESNPLDMEVIVSDSVKRLKLMIDESNAEIIQPEQWPTVRGYGPWIEEVWMNYISNALKYGGEPPKIELGADRDGDMVRFWVQDNGKGLTPEEQQRVFTPFTRLNTVKVEGHGLGLSVVQRIVHKLGGEVGVESTLGEGSRFSFTLPVEDQETP